MSEFGNWILGISMGVLGLGGLFFASHAKEEPIYVAGLILFAFAVLFIFYLIKDGYDRAERGESH